MKAMVSDGSGDAVNLVSEADGPVTPGAADAVAGDMSKDESHTMKL
jgi:hypothetical protein